MTSALPHLAVDAATPQLPDTLRRIVLTGFMGAGKSTIGRLLAAELDWKFLDLDAHLEVRAGASIPELFVRHGEAHFRRLESTALVSALGQAYTVLALGGGTPELLTNRLLLEQTPGTLTVFLDASFETLYDRCILQGGGDPMLARPVLTDPNLARARFMQRQPAYRRLAGLTLATEDLTPQETIAALLLSLEKSRSTRRL